jgi:Raf kinase inhibitor-like YbhB/YbcL family protein
VLVVEDPDAPSGYDIPLERTSLPEGATSSLELAGQGVNDFGNAHYDGPQPPKGHGAHHYHFRLAAVDVPKLDLPSGAKAEQVWRVARPHIVAEAELVGTYER